MEQKEDRAKELQNNINRLKFEITDKIYRSTGSIFVIDSGHLPIPSSAKQVLSDMLSTGLTWIQEQPEQGLPIEELDYRIDDEDLIRLIKELRAAQDEQYEFYKIQNLNEHKS